MLDELWNRFKEAGYSGSISSRFAIKSDSEEDDRIIHEAVYDIDPDYVSVCVIKNYSKDSHDLPVLEPESFSSKESAIKALENAVLEGLGHKKAFVIKGTGTVVRFGYEGDSLV